MFRILSSIMILSGLLVGIIRGASAAQQDPTGWSTPQWIPGLIDTIPSQYPYFIVDPAGKLHVFHSQWVGDNFSIVYSAWSMGVGWSAPVDVILSPYEQARIVGATLDDVGTVHVFFWGGNEQAANMYHTTAPLADAGRTQSWSQPVIIGAHAISPTTGAAIGDGHEYILLVYSGNLEGNGLYSVTSYDRGETWTEPSALFFPANDALWPSSLYLMMANSDTIHAVWQLSDVTGNSRRIYHVTLHPDDEAWTSPVILAQPTGSTVELANIVEKDGELIIVYSNSMPLTRWMIRSNDDGRTWTAPVRLFQQVGSNGTPAFVEDSGGTLHMFFGNRLSGSQDIHGIWHSRWTGSAWTAPEPVVSGPQIPGGEKGEEGFDPGQAQSFIIQGNILFLAWRHDPQAGPQHVWYTYKVLDTPAVIGQSPVTALTPTKANSVGLDPTPTAALTARPTLPQDVLSTDNFGRGNLSIAILVGIVPVFFFLLAAIVIIVRRR